MHDWALTQGMVDGRSAILITDEAGAVTPDGISDAVEAVIAAVAPEQLIVYFAGHGVVLRRSEQWLLSKSPEKSTHAVDVIQSGEDASFGEVPHVVLISDACRTAPEGIQAQNVQGGSIFPNNPSAQMQFVDIYYACGLGKPAAEIVDESASVKSYKAVYTAVLLDALTGRYHEAFVHGDDGWYADARPLRDVLALEVPRAIRAKKLKARYGQVPQAKLLSDPGAWLSRLDKLPRAKRVAATPPAPSDVLGGPLGLDDEEPTDTATTVVTPRSFGPKAFETQCGFKAQGARIIDVYPALPHAEVLWHDRAFRARPSKPTTVVMRLDGDRVVVLPAIPGYIGALRFDGNELTSVAYEPSANNWRADMFAERSRDIRRLRAVASDASAVGRFSLDGEDTERVARQMQFAKGVDPALAIYAAYAYYEQHDINRIRQMSKVLRRDLGTSLFDIELLSRELVDRELTPGERVLPPVPLLSQGWSLVRAHRVKLPQDLLDVETQAWDSLWSVYRDAAYDVFKQCIRIGAIR